MLVLRQPSLPSEVKTTYLCLQVGLVTWQRISRLLLKLGLICWILNSIDWLGRYLNLLTKLIRPILLLRVRNDS